MTDEMDEPRECDVKTKLSDSESIQFTRLRRRLGLTEAALARMAIKVFMADYHHMRSSDSNEGPKRASSGHRDE